MAHGEDRMGGRRPDGGPPYRPFAEASVSGGQSEWASFTPI